MELTFSRVYEDEQIGKEIQQILPMINDVSLFAEFKKNGEMQAKFFSVLLKDTTKTFNDAWSEIIYDMAEKYVVESIERERELRKKCNASIPEDSLPINLKYSVVYWK